MFLVLLMSSYWVLPKKHWGIDYEKLEDAIRSVFGRKGEAVVDANIKALAIGKAAQK